MARWLLDSFSKHSSFPEQEVVAILVPETVAWCLHFGAWEPFCYSEAPWKTVGATGKTCGGLELHFIDFRTIWDPHFDSSLGTEGSNIFLFPGLFPYHFRSHFCIEIGMSGAPKTRFSI